MKPAIIIKLITALLALALAASAAVPAPRVNPRKGKVYYKKYCRTCHAGETANAAELSPMSKTMEQWTRAFAEGADVASCHPRVKDQSGTELTKQDLLDIQAYLVQHAADSDQPATCGN